MATYPEVSIPAPRGAAEPTAGRRPRARPGGVAGQPGWLSLVEALDRFAAGLVARLEQQLTQVDEPDQVALLRRQRDRALALDAITSDAAAHARRATAAHPAPEPARAGTSGTSGTS